MYKKYSLMSLPTWLNLKIKSPHEYRYKPTSRLIPSSIPSKLNLPYTNHSECPNILCPPIDQVYITFSLNIHIFSLRSLLSTFVVLTKSICFKILVILYLSTFTCLFTILIINVTFPCPVEKTKR